MNKNKQIPSIFEEGEYAMQSDATDIDTSCVVGLGSNDRF